MNHVSAPMRLAIGLATLSMTVVFAAFAIGIIPDNREELLRGRAAMAEGVAVRFTAVAQGDDPKRLTEIGEAIRQRNPNIQSMAVRTAERKLLVEIGDHDAWWESMPLDKSTPTQIQVPISRDGQRWGHVEIRFEPLPGSGWMGILQDPGMRLSIFVALVGFVLFFFYLKRTLRHLDPSSVIPDRVKSVLDTMSEGVLVMDGQERIVMANTAFEKATGHSHHELQGRQATRIIWNKPKGREPMDELPWSAAIREGQPQKSVPMSIKRGHLIRDPKAPKEKIPAESRILMVNATPILGPDGSQRGAMATFDDVTGLEEKNTELERMLRQLEKSREKIKSQNDELQLLATRDTLTQCLNRRALFDRFEAEMTSADRYGHELSCVMLDIDHFKLVNDNHGHSVGDQVLAKVAEVLRESVRKSDIICRYGGEEFVVILPHTDLANAGVAAEKFRKNIESTQAGGIFVTSSFGVSALSLGADTEQQMIDQADQALYAAKHAGRNRVVRWDRMPHTPELEAATRQQADAPSEEQRTPIPFHAVTALMSALAHRDPATADHSRRVADLCVATAQKLMSASDCFVLEVAALLHDIGKVGVPDNVLLKPGPLTAEEWEIMERHDEMGIEIISAAFSSTELTNIVRSHHAFYDGKGRHKDLPTGRDIPLRARILTIADAYDAIVSDRVYRKGRSQEEAFAELRKCADRQFDPEMVEQFIETVQARDENRSSRPLAAETETGIRIGMELERMMSALDTMDVDDLKEGATSLASVAHQLQLPEIERLAGELGEAADVRDDLTQMVATANELVELCRTTQSSCMTGGEEKELEGEETAEVEPSSAAGA